MVRRRLARVRDEVKERLVKAFLDKHSSHEVAFSFSVGIFITALPTLGTGVLVFFVLAFLFERISKIALFASVVVLNPVVKWGVYGTSYTLGRLILGPVPGVSFSSFKTVSPSMGFDVLARLWLGNIILAITFSVVAYAIGLRLINEFRRRLQNDEVPMVDISADTATVDE
jgi:uncharacterized protein (DUF2062 family)